MKKISVIMLLIFFIFSANALAMKFYRSKNVGEITLAPSGIFEIKGAISNIGQPFTNPQFIKAYNFKKGNIPYNKGVAYFALGGRSIYFHYDSKNGGSGVISQIGDQDIKNTVSVGMGIPTQLNFVEASSSRYYILINSDPSGLIGPTHTVIGRQLDGSYVKYFDTADIKRKYFKDPRAFHLSEDVLFYEDSIIVPYHNTSNETQRGEFRFKWDDKAQWFGIEQVQVSPITITTTHEYYTSNITSDQRAQADKVAREIANYVLAQKNLTTDLDKVKLAATIVRKISFEGKYGSDPNKYYRTPYGVFIAKISTCAGTTTALGRVLEFMGYKWAHANKNRWTHQWCVLKMDGKKGYADPAFDISESVGYGEYQAGENAVRETLESQK
ncbi:MAG: hypothetical protein IKN43_00950 [Selenomonadaceae bacterium]|nr:hypothetical protein [Selenomonadaceae bacterium]